MKPSTLEDYGAAPAPAPHPAETLAPVKHTDHRAKPLAERQAAARHLLAEARAREATPPSTRAPAQTNDRPAPLGLDRRQHGRDYGLQPTRPQRKPRFYARHQSHRNQTALKLT